MLKNLFSFRFFFSSKETNWISISGFLCAYVCLRGFVHRYVELESKKAPKVLNKYKLFPTLHVVQQINRHQRYLP
jgi:hypothetical protein